ncbi:MAG: YkgJ family cysteine cluster protein [Peptococcaceae bacterium]|nr:YkgJ family cysteine cluster protein [Peptococcaceae bacterium]
MSGPVTVVGREKGYEVSIRSDRAVLSDYTRAMEAFIDTNEYRRLRAETNRCKGCDICCRERAPLTAVDLWILKENAEKGLDWRSFFQRFVTVRVFSGGVDIVLARDGDDNCVFLDSGRGLCGMYPYRPLVCSTYICAQASPSAQLFRSSVVNGGEDAAVGLWYAQTAEEGLVVHECEDFDPGLLEIPPENVWNVSKNYDNILIREVISGELWKRLEGKP